jgi:hypothetical protein
MTTSGRVRLSVAIGGLLLMSAVPMAQPAEGTRIGSCLREGARFAGKTPVTPGKGVRAPKRIRNVKPDYPEPPAGTVGSGVWIGEVLLGIDGKVSHVWAIREVQFTPPFPEFDQAIAEAVRRWEYEPVGLESEGTPVCITVTVNINWR